jgi:hypothetical protein
MKSAAAPTQTMRRACTRLRYGLAAGCRAFDGRTWSARALNLAREGCRLIYWSEEMRPPRVELQFRTADAREMKVRAQVKSAQQCGKLWLLDCEFLRQLTNSELARFRASDQLSPIS